MNKGSAWLCYVVDNCYNELAELFFCVSRTPIKFTFIVKSELLVFYGLLRVAVSINITVVLDRVESFAFI